MKLDEHIGRYKTEGLPVPRVSSLSAPTSTALDYEESRMVNPPEHETVCKLCGAHVPSGTPQHQILGAGPTCEPCGRRAQENWLNYKRRQVEHNRRRREEEYQEREVFTSEGGALGALYECAQCGQDYLLDRPHFHTHPITQHLCDTCEHIYWTVSQYQHNLRRDHGLTSSQLRRDQRAKRGLRSELRRAQS